MSKNIFIGAGALVLFSIIVVFFVGFVLVFIDQYGEFEYTTGSGENGTASFCIVSYGQARCMTDDGTTIIVERYTKK